MCACILDLLRRWSAREDQMCKTIQRREHVYCPSFHPSARLLPLGSSFGVCNLLNMSRPSLSRFGSSELALSTCRPFPYVYASSFPFFFRLFFYQSSFSPSLFLLFSFPPLIARQTEPGSGSPSFSLSSAHL